MVFIPGLTFSGEIFKNQLEYFSSEYRVIAIDPRGQGYSAKTVDGNDYLTHGRDVAGLIDAFSLTLFSTISDKAPWLFRWIAKIIYSVKNISVYILNVSLFALMLFIRAATLPWKLLQREA